MHWMMIVWSLSFSQTASIMPAATLEKCMAPAGFYGYCLTVEGGELRIEDARGSINFYQHTGQMK